MLAKCLPLPIQICVLHSVNHGPLASEYNVSGTTYAPDGFIFDSMGVQVLFLITCYMFSFLILFLPVRFSACWQCFISRGPIECVDIKPLFSRN